jgi:hypothetical protein
MSTDDPGLARHLPRSRRHATPHARSNPWRVPPAEPSAGKGVASSRSGCPSPLANLRTAGRPASQPAAGTATCSLVSPPPPHNSRSLPRQPNNPGPRRGARPERKRPQPTPTRRQPTHLTPPNRDGGRATQAARVRASCRVPAARRNTTPWPPCAPPPSLLSIIY